eukprot:9435008-Alexandrium_andersonii.AAC.1
MGRSSPQRGGAGRTLGSPRAQPGITSTAASDGVLWEGRGNNRACTSQQTPPGLALKRRRSRCLKSRETDPGQRAASHGAGKHPMPRQH